MITLLHGDNITASRSAYIALKAAVPATTETRVVEGRGITPSMLEQAVSSHSMFDEGIAVFIENLFGALGRKPKLIQAFGEILTGTPAASIVVWEGKEVGREVISALGPGAKVQAFPFPKTVFAMIDGMKPGSAKDTLGLLSKTLETEEPEVVLALFIGRVRQLIMVKDKFQPERASPWQLGRLTKQSSLFTMDGLLSMHDTLCAIDVETKTGRSPLTLPRRLESFVLSSL